ncbi:helix-turn-helix domain-containing protein [Flavobacterium branchiophilum]|uniref:Transcriptional regulator n=1 Tax=Flavobacterium branchiophilum TaxID=55197 RepID=A0A2H3L1K6_9FLAO|nr:helix-turn-helix transcriptional regulator [Flavobacterium branchiophilum]PDS26730.1 transcriptional regulator [Flavobacterium branchiophilum]
MQENINKQIGDRIKQLRKVENLSQEALANIAEIERGYVNGVETGKRNVSVKILSKIIKALNTDFVEFFNDEIFKK